VTDHPHIGDEMLIAYLDGELDEAGMAAVDAALATDATLVDRLEAHAALATRVRAAYASVTEEPVPERLTSLIQPTGAKVVDLASRRRPSPTYVWWGAIAASLVVGVMLVGRELPLPFADPIGQDMTARGRLAKALTVQASGPGKGEVEIGLSFKARDGRYCRTFALDETSGLACRRDRTWKVEAAAPRPAMADGEFRQAASATAAPVLDKVDALIAGEALDADQERQAMKAGWR
jgi:hypothetical protein